MSAANGITKADLVRQRQKQASQGRVKQTTKAVQQPIKSSSVPVMTRKEAFAVSYPAFPKQTNRRQYNYSIGATGAAVRLPAISSINIGWRFLSFFLGIFCLVGIFLLFNSSEFRVQQIQTSGLTRLTANDLNAVLNISGESLVWFDAQQAKNDLLIAFPELKEIKISVAFPNDIHYKLNAYQALLEKFNSEGIYPSMVSIEFAQRPYYRE